MLGEMRWQITNQGLNPIHSSSFGPGRSCRRPLGPVVVYVCSIPNAAARTRRLLSAVVDNAEPSRIGIETLACIEADANADRNERSESPMYRRSELDPFLGGFCASRSTVKKNERYDQNGSAEFHDHISQYTLAEGMPGVRSQIPPVAR
jgi:hypothetical protein